ncbi:TIGR04076 family protein [Candidatus Bipolaricaulota bacterium]|nr:TIGR04076 family protein [Candidatus Bipolaricaulota bacterium]
MLSDPSEVPDGFCAWAWADTHREIRSISGGSDFGPSLKQPGLAVACCTDAFRPVALKIERGSKMV